MNIKKSLLTSAIALCVIATSSGALHASSKPHLYPTPAAGPVATTTAPSATTVKSFVWSNQTVTVGTKLKLSKIVTVKVKGKSNYRATGTCSLRKGVLVFKRVGKCRVSVSLKLQNSTKVLRSSKVFSVKPENAVAATPASGMPDPIGCTKASSHPVSGTPYPDSEPGFYELQTGWNCDQATLDARPLLEYFKSQGWVQKSSTSGMSTADLYKGSNRVTYSVRFDGMAEGQAFLLLTIY